MDISTAGLDTETCPTCHTVLARGARHCIACLLRLGCDWDEAGDLEESAFDEVDLEGAAEAGRGSWPEIANYRVLREVGEGGFAVVYAAEQLRPMRREVAVKVIKPGMDTRGVIARFASERQALAVMDHPGIARIFDAGTTRGGHAFFAMELVGGPPLTEFCDRGKLGFRERIGIFMEVCQAVQHAHQKGVIHRDLKPSNILVAGHDGKPSAKVIDFGIAKATGDLRLGDRTIFTAFEPFIGTPAYMSPEQADFGGIDIDTRSDIYSLGAVLYELLAGAPPFEQLSQVGLDEMRRRIREETPPRPSARFGALPEARQKSIAADRSTDPAKLSGALRGDLDLVILKALEKDRTRRYASAAGFAADLRRCLEMEPVSARAPSRFYQIRKFASRNKAAVAGAGAIALAIIAAAIISTVAAVRAQRAEQRALTEAAKTEQTAEFLSEAFQSVNPDVARGHDTTLLRAILDDADARIKDELTQSPEVAAHLRKVIGWTYSKIGDPLKAEANLKEAVRLARGVPGDEIDLCSALDWLSYVEMGLHPTYVEAPLHPSPAEAPAREAYAIQTRLAASLDHRGADARALATYNVALCKVLIAQHDIDEGVAIERKWLAFQQDVLGPKDPAVANSLSVLGEAEEQGHHLPEAEQYYRQVLAIQQQAGGTEQLTVSNTLGHIASVLGKRGDLAGAEALEEQSLALGRKLLPPGHPDFVLPLVGLAAFQIEDGHLDQAETSLREAMVIAAKGCSWIGVKRVTEVIATLADALDKHGEKARADALRRDGAPLRASIGLAQ